ncbi:MAG: thiazole synthase [Nitratireductor sp.]
MNKDTNNNTFYGTMLKSPLMLGTAQYPSPDILSKAIKASGCDVVTVSLRREDGEQGSGQTFWKMISDLNVNVLPNTAGCHTVKDAVTTAHMAREFFNTKWIKLEVIADNDTLCPNVIELVEAARILNEDGFQVFPYTTQDLSIANKLLEVGCEVLMPWGAPIGTGLGLNDVYGLRSIRSHFPDTPMVIDAGLGKPSHAASAMEMGFDAVLLNTAVAKAGDPIGMASAFAKALEAGRQAYIADPMEPRDMASPSTPVLGTATFGSDLK